MTIPLLNHEFDDSTFSILYDRLKNNITKDKVKTVMLYDTINQMKYINLIDYLTDTDERSTLLCGIEWTSMFWIEMLAKKFQNLNTFFNKKDLCHGYELCLTYLSDNYELTDKHISELDTYFFTSIPVARTPDIIENKTSLEELILKIEIDETYIFKKMIETLSKFDDNEYSIFSVSNDKIFLDNPSKNDERKNGIHITRLTRTKDILVKIYLDADRFHFFYCHKPEIRIDINMSDLNRRLKSIDDQDTIILSMKSNDRTKLYITSGNGDVEIMINLPQITYQPIPIPIPIPPLKFERVITMSTNYFYSTCRKLEKLVVKNLGIEILLTNNILTFHSTYNNTKFLHQLGAKNIKCETNLSMGVFDEYNLLRVSNIKYLSTTVNFYFKKDFPLVLMTNVGTMGHIYIYICPLINF